jgi:DNA helicase-2/ATP-dependent DNA helicase PcrA
VAVLFRINAQSEAYEEALTARGIPYVVRGVERFFERSEVKQAMTLLRGSARAGESSGDLVGDAVGVLSTMGWTAQSPAGAGAQRNRWESLQAMVTLTEDFAQQRPDAALGDLVEELERRAQSQHAPVADGVTLATLHAAKGLEWEAVFCVGMHESTMPIVYATTPAAVEEERRLFYVGVTRARTTLHVSWAAARSPGARGSRRPTRFLDGIRPADAGDAPTVGGGQRARKSRSVGTCRSCGRALSSAAERKIGRCDDCPATYDEALFERLRSWRSEQANAQKVPAYVVFTDATLTAIAEIRPRDQRELLKIPGLGRTKLDRYGDDVLGLLSATSDAPTAPK